MNRHTACATFVAAMGAALALVSASASAGKPAPPPPPDPCLTVTAATFPSFAFQRNTTPKNGPYTFTTYLADASGQCAKFVATWPVDHSYDMRYDSASRKVLIVSLSGGGLAGATYEVSFDGNKGPVVATATEPVTMLDFTALSAPSDLEPGWTWYGWDDFVVSPDGSQILIGGSYKNGSTPVKVQNTFWTCDLNSTAPSINASSCKEVHRGPVNPNWGVKANWGATAATIYVTEPPPDDLNAISLYRLTLPTDSVPGSFVKVFSDGKALRMPRTLPNGTGGELVAIFEQGPMPENCQKVIVIDPATCVNYSCTVLNNQGLGNWVRTVTWLPDGRVAGVGQTAPNRQGRCVSTGTVVAFPAIDPNGTSVTTLTTGTNPEGAGGG